jgi:hypothetical protein
MRPEKKKELSFELKNSLMQLYKEDIKELEGLTGKIFSNWLKTTNY